VVGFTDQLPMKKSYESDFNMIDNLQIPNTNRIYVIAKVINLYILYIIYAVLKRSKWSLSNYLGFKWGIVREWTKQNNKYRQMVFRENEIVKWLQKWK